jgi:hypothetical protein
MTSWPCASRLRCSASCCPPASAQCALVVCSGGEGGIRGAVRMQRGQRGAKTWRGRMSNRVGQGVVIVCMCRGCGSAGRARFCTVLRVEVCCAALHGGASVHASTCAWPAHVLLCSPASAQCTPVVQSGVGREVHEGCRGQRARMHWSAQTLNPHPSSSAATSANASSARVHASSSWSGWRPASSWPKRSLSSPADAMRLAFLPSHRDSRCCDTAAR